MNASRVASRHNGLYAGLALLAALSLYYLYRAIRYRFFGEGLNDTDFLNNQYWLFLHLLFALPVILGAPLQFVPRLRQRRPRVHRAIGKAYVFGASGAAVAAIYLGATSQYEGSRLSIVLTGLLWLFFTLAAWRFAVAKNFAVHRSYMIRSYTLALVLVWLRLMYDFQDYLFFFVSNEELRDATREWASWVIPLLVVELWLSWLPPLRRSTSRSN